MNGNYGWLWSAVLVAGCGGAPADSLTDSMSPGTAWVEPGGVESRLAEPWVDLRVLPFDTVGAVQARRTQAGASYSSLALRGDGGLLRLHVDPAAPSTLVLDSALIRLSDVELPAELLPPSGMTLTQLRLEVAQPAQGALTWLGQTGEAEALLEAEVLLRGAFRTESDVVSPFEEQRFARAPIRLSFSTAEGGRLEVRFRFERTDPSWSWADLVETQDFALQGRAVESIPDAQLLR